MSTHPNDLGNLSSLEEMVMPKRAGFQRGRLIAQGSSWIGYWNEKVFDRDRENPKTGMKGVLRWKTRCIKISPLTRLNPDTGREVKVSQHEARVLFEEFLRSQFVVHSTNPATLATVLELWQKIKPTLALKARKTQQHWNLIVEKHILPKFARRQLRGLRQGDVQELILEKVQLGYSPQTVWHIRTTITTLFKKAKGLGWYSGDLPTEGLEMPKLAFEERTPPTAQQLEQMIAALASPAREIVAFLAFTGLNKSEMEGLRWRRVNLDEHEVLCDGRRLAPQCLAVREQFVRVYGKKLDVARGQYQGVKARKRIREVPLTPEVLEVLREVRSQSKWTSPDDPVFACQENGQPLNAQNLLRRKIRPVLQKLKLPLSIDLHSLRHYTASAADAQGMTEGARQRLLGHATPSMTQRYTHAELERARPAFEAISAGFSSLLSPKKKPSGRVIPMRSKRKDA